MRTHEAIKVLTALANALKNSSFETVEELTDGGSKKVPASAVDVPRALAMLVALSNFDKLQWAQIISEYEFPIDVRPRDASRDIMGKLLKYLEANPDARLKLARTTGKSRSKTSPELTQALEILLKS